MQPLPRRSALLVRTTLDATCADCGKPVCPHIFDHLFPDGGLGSTWVLAKPLGLTRTSGLTGLSPDEPDSYCVEPCVRPALPTTRSPSSMPCAAGPRRIGPRAWSSFGPVGPSWRR